MHKIIIINKGDQEFEGDQGGVFKRVWKEEREGRNVIIISKRKTQNRNNNQKRKLFVPMNLNLSLYFLITEILTLFT